MEGNKLFPVFLKLDQLHTVIIGAGNVGLEKLSALLNNDPNAIVTIIGKNIHPEIMALSAMYQNVQFIAKEYNITDLNDKDIVIAATNDRALNGQIRRAAKAFKLLVNVADTPDLCDFYLGSVVKKGDMKIGISTNGKSPTFAKRFREFLEDTLPEDIPELLEQLNIIRSKLKGDFNFKVKQLNELTKTLTKTV